MYVLVKNTLLHHCFHFPHCWSAFYRPAGCRVIAVICGMTAVTWFDPLTNQRHSAFSIPHFTFRIPQFPILPATNPEWTVNKLKQEADCKESMKSARMSHDIYQ